MKKIFVIGFNKCGTRTLHQFFKANNLRTYHVGMNYSEFTTQVETNLTEGRPILDGLGNYVVFCDMPEKVFKDFKRIDKDYPNSYFILNSRPIDKWILSRLNHGKGTYWQWLNSYLQVNRSKEEWVSFWRKDWEDHHRNVLEYFSDRSEDLLVFDIENDRPQKLKSFLNTYRLNASKWGHQGKTKKPTFKSLK